MHKRMKEKAKVNIVKKRTSHAFITSEAKHDSLACFFLETKSTLEVKFVYIFFRGIMKGTFFDVLKKDLSSKREEI